MNKGIKTRVNKHILAAIFILLAATPAAAMGGGGGGGKYNPGDTLSNVYLNPDAGPGFGIGSGFGLPQHRKYYVNCPYRPGHACWALPPHPRLKNHR